MQVAMLGEDYAYARSGDLMGGSAWADSFFRDPRGPALLDINWTTTDNPSSQVQDAEKVPLSSAAAKEARQNLILGYLNGGVGAVTRLYNTYKGRSDIPASDKAGLEQVYNALTKTIPWAVGGAMALIAIVVLSATLRKKRR